MFLQGRRCSQLPKPLGSWQTFSLPVWRTAGRPNTPLKGEELFPIALSASIHLINLFVNYLFHLGKKNIMLCNFEATLYFSDCSARSIDLLFPIICCCLPYFLLVKRTNQPVGRMTGERLLLTVMLMSVLSLLTLPMSHGEILAEESCTIQLLVPGLKGTLSFCSLKAVPHSFVPQVFF